MARNKFTLTNSAEVALTAATAKTALQVVAAAANIIAIQGVSVSFDGVTATDAPVVCQIWRQTGAGTSSARTPVKTTDRASALLATGRENCTVEPASDDALLDTFECHPQSGITKFYGDAEFEVPASGRVGVKLTAPANVNVLVTLHCEE